MLFGWERAGTIPCRPSSGVTPTRTKMGPKRDPSVSESKLPEHSVVCFSPGTESPMTCPMSQHYRRGKRWFSDQQILKCRPQLSDEVVKVTLFIFSTTGDLWGSQQNSAERMNQARTIWTCRPWEVDAVQTLKHVAFELHHPLTSNGFFPPLHFNQVNKSTQKAPPPSTRPLCLIQGLITDVGTWTGMFPLKASLAVFFFPDQ